MDSLENSVSSLRKLLNITENVGAGQDEAVAGSLAVIIICTIVGIVVWLGGPIRLYLNRKFLPKNKNSSLYFLILVLILFVWFPFVTFFSLFALLFPTTVLKML